jgi:1-acyl-sn-glycerol-3-phosphate acyltransferase
VPLALNSGVFWPRRSLRRYPGTIVVEFLEPIPPGLPRATFRAELQRRIEEASSRLAGEGEGVAEAAADAAAAPQNQ